LEVRECVTLMTTEFAGIKFQLPPETKNGKQYIKFVSQKVSSLLRLLPNVRRMVLCEEKYDFTPDVFKGCTREQRTKANKGSISHLKTSNMILSDTSFDREAVMHTKQGKILVSNYIGNNPSDLDVKHDVILDIDSQAHKGGCTCQATDHACKCEKFCIPVRAYYTKEGYIRHEHLQTIKQKKGEGEMAQIDWLQEMQDELNVGEAVVSYLTSGDIDAIPIHLFYVASKWPRKMDNTFKHPVFCILRKKNVHDTYNITEIVTTLEKVYGDPKVAQKIAIGLCMGGNDYIPRLHGKNHTSVLRLVLHSSFITSLFDAVGNNFTLNVDMYIELIKYLYIGKKYDTGSYEEIRKITMFKKNSKELNLPHSWLPPESVMRAIAQLVQLQIDYFSTLGKHDADLPNFSTASCLKLNVDGSIKYNFGPDVFQPNVPQTVFLTPKKNKKRVNVETPKKGKSRKKIKTSTPRKTLAK